MEAVAPPSSMERVLEDGTSRTEANSASTEAVRQVREATGENSGEGQPQLDADIALEAAAQRQTDDGRNSDTVRTSLANFRQSASRTTGQIRELLETSKVLDHEFVAFMQDPRTKAFLDGGEDEDDDADNNLLDGAEEESLDNPKEIEALKQKTKSLKRKLRKWRKAARMALSEICPDISPDAQGDMTPGTMKNVLQRIRQLKSLTEKQTSIILALTGQCETQKSESDEKDMLIMELLRNCNGIRPALVKGDQQTEKLSKTNEKDSSALDTTAAGFEGSGVSNLEGMVAKKENVDFPLSTAAEVEEVLTQTGIQFGSAHLIPAQINRDGDCSGVTIASSEFNPSTNAGTTLIASAPGASASQTDRKAREDVPINVSSASESGVRHAPPNRKVNVWMGLAVGASAGLCNLLVGNLTRRFDN